MFFKQCKLWNSSCVVHFPEFISAPCY